MTDTLIERACQRFSKELSPEDDREIKSTSIDDVRQAIRLVERQLAARQCLRNLDRLKPYLDGIERYSKAIEILANAVPYLAYTWVWMAVTPYLISSCSKHRPWAISDFVIIIYRLRLRSY